MMIYFAAATTAMLAAGIPSVTGFGIGNSESIPHVIATAVRSFGDYGRT
ncbi:MAG: hypothetical protein ACR2JB_01475 [Bryobacteraceae bacterium]